MTLKICIVGRQCTQIAPICPGSCIAYPVIGRCRITAIIEITASCPEIITGHRPSLDVIVCVISSIGEIDIHAPSFHEGGGTPYGESGHIFCKLIHICLAYFSRRVPEWQPFIGSKWVRSEEHTSELQSRGHLVCR